MSSERFIISERGDEVTDTTTGLTWARCSVGQTWDGKKCNGEVKKMKYDEAMAYAEAKEGWRLPTKDELASLVDKNYKPTINNVAFPNTESYPYWSSSPYAGYSNDAWDVSFGDGNVYYGYRSVSLAVRLVKGE